MKTLTAAQKTARDAAGHSISRIIKFEWPVSGDLYYTERGESEFHPDIANIAIIPLVASFPQTARNVNLGIADAGPFQRATFSLWIDPNDIQNIETRVDDENPTGALVTMYQLLEAVGIETSADWSTLGRYRIESWRVVYGESGNVVRFDCIDFSQQLGDKEIGRVITDDLYADAPGRSFGQMIPLIFGAVEDSPCPLVTTGERTTLDASLDDEDGVIEVVLADDFPASGTIQIDNERISYTDKSDAADTLGTAGTPAVRGVDGTTPMTHFYGAAVIEIASSYRFLVADKVTEPAKAITGATNATPIVITALTHGYANGDFVFIDGVGSNTAANGFWGIDNKTADTFELVGSVGNGAYTSGGNSYRLDISDISNVQMKKIALNPATDYSINVIDDGEEHVAVLDVTTLPADSASGFTTQQALEDLVTPISWAAGGSNTANNPLNAVDTDDDKHVSFADVTQGETLHLDQDNDLTDNIGDIKGAKVIVEYQTDHTTKDVWPGTAPTIKIYEGAVEKVSKNMGEPADIDTAIFPNGAPGDDSTDLFDTTSGANNLIGEFGSGYISGYNVDLDLGDVGCKFDFYSWPFHEDLSANEDPIVYTADGQNTTFSCLGVALDCGYTGPPEDPGHISTAQLKVKPLLIPDGIKATKIEVDVVASGIITPVTQGEVRLYMQCGGDTTSDIFDQPPSGDNIHCSISLTGDYDKAEIEAAQLWIWGRGEGNTPRQVTRSARFIVTNIAWRVYGESPIYEGGTTALEGLGLSSRVRQEVDITATVRAAGGWDFFNTGASGFDVAIIFAAQANTTVLRVYNVTVEVELLGGAGGTLITEDTAELTANVTGYFGADPAKISSEEAITRLLEDSDFYGLVGGDHTGLAAAISDATNAGAIDWRLDRRIGMVTTLRELLAQAVTDAGIRYTMDGGKFIFYAHVYANVSDIDTGDNYTLARTNMTSLPTKERTHIDLVRNQVAVYYRRAFTGEFGFARKREGDDALSQAQPWGVRRKTYDAEWIRDNDVADALADRMVADFAQNRVTMQLTFAAGRTLHHEVGDAVQLDDDLTRLTGQVGRIVGAAYPSAALQRFTLAVTDRRTRLFNDATSASYVDVWAGMQRVEVVVDGVKVAIISVDGLRLKGELLEEAFDPEVGQTAAIEYDDTGTNMIVVSVFPGAAYYRAMEFHVTGDARVYQLDEQGTTFPTLAFSGDAEDYVFHCGTDEETPGALTRGFAQLIELLVGGEENATFETRELYENAV